MKTKPYLKTRLHRTLLVQFVDNIVCERDSESYLMQPSQSMLPMFSLMVLSETKAGYSVSHGTCMVGPAV